MDTDTILRNFGRRVVCTQQVCTRFAPRLGISRAQALGLFAAVCAPMVAATCEILGEMLATETTQP